MANLQTHPLPVQTVNLSQFLSDPLQTFTLQTPFDQKFRAITQEFFSAPPSTLKVNPQFLQQLAALVLHPEQVAKVHHLAAMIILVDVFNSGGSIDTLLDKLGVPFANEGFETIKFIYELLRDIKNLHVRKNLAAVLTLIPPKKITPEIVECLRNLLKSTFCDEIALQVSLTLEAVSTEERADLLLHCAPFVQKLTDPKYGLEILQLIANIPLDERKVTIRSAIAMTQDRSDGAKIISALQTTLEVPSNIRSHLSQTMEKMGLSTVRPLYPSDEEDLYKQGKNLYMKGRFQQAADKFKASRETGVEPQAKCNLQIGKCLYALGQFNNALKCFEDAEHLYSSSSNAKAHYAMRALYNKALCHVALGDFNLALDCLERSEIKDYSMECRDITTREVANSIRQLERKLEEGKANLTRLNPSIDLAHLTAHLEKVGMGINHPLTSHQQEENNSDQKLLSVVARCLIDRGQLLQALGKLEEALKDYEMSLKIQERVYGKEHPKLVSPLMHLGVCFVALGRYTQALPILERALGKQAVWFGSSPSYSEILSALGSCLYALGEYRRSLELHVKAHLIRLDSYGNGHPLVADSLNHQGNCLSALGRHLEAKERYENSLKIRQQFYGPDHLLVADSLQSLGSLYSLMGQKQDANQKYNEALAIWEKTSGSENHRSVLWIKSCIDALSRSPTMLQTEGVDSLPDDASIEELRPIILSHVIQQLEKIESENSIPEIIENPSGFLRIHLAPPPGHPLSSKMGDIRVHYWPSLGDRDFEVIEAAHNHPRPFISLVVQGGYSQIKYTLAEDDSTSQKVPYRAYRILKEQTADHDKRNIVCYGSAELKISSQEECNAGENLVYDRIMIHSVTKAKPRTLTVNIVFKSKSTPNFDVFMAPGNHQDPKVSRETGVSPSRTKAIVSEILKTLTKLGE